MFEHRMQTECMSLMSCGPVPLSSDLRLEVRISLSKQVGSLWENQMENWGFEESTKVWYLEAVCKLTFLPAYRQTVSLKTCWFASESKLYYFLAACIRHLTFQRYDFFQKWKWGQYLFQSTKYSAFENNSWEVISYRIIIILLQTWVFLSIRSFISRQLPFENTKSISYNINSLGTTLMHFFKE